MISINTNLSSLIAQSSMKKATFSLNQAVERMTTGFKINHAKDNAANYSITQNMTTKINSYMVAQDNVAMGLDMLTTASDMISTMQDHATRLRDLATQARNGTYGASSMNAINAEVEAILSELDRLYNTAEYNKVALFNKKEYVLSPEHQALAETVSAKEEYGGFIADPKTYEDSYVDGLTSVTSAISGAGLQANKKYKVSSKEDLQAIATFVNGGGDTTNMTFIMSEDIDLSSIASWIPIGTDTAGFKGIFDGNGHKITNLKTTDNTKNYQGLFGYTSSTSEIKNIGVEDVDIKGKDYVGGLVGKAWGKNTNCYATGNVSGDGENVGGLAGHTSIITNSYASGYVSGSGNNVGGLIGIATNTISNCYATGNVSGGYNFVGGLVGQSSNTISNSYATGNVSGLGQRIGGLIGYTEGNITNSYASGYVSGNTFVGGIVGRFYKTSGSANITDCASYSLYVTGNDESSTGSLIGGAVLTTNGTSFATLSISNCKTISQDINMIGNVYKYQNPTLTLLPDYDMTAMLSGISEVITKGVETGLQIGVNSGENCRLSFDTNFDLDLGGLSGDITSDTAFNNIDKFVKLLSEKATQLGAVQNRLESALDEIETQFNNLVSSRSTLRDADIAKESSAYIRQQILQEASATLLATANQSPSIALQLI